MRSSWIGSQAAALAASLWMAGCQSQLDNRTAIIDTLPSGIVRIVNTEPAWRHAEAAWTLSPPTRFGDGDGSPGELIQPIMVRTDSWGRVYIVDRQPIAIKVFDAQGRMIRTIGRTGGGPGEYRVAFPAIANGRLIVHDPQQQRTSVFDTSSTFLHSWASSCCNWNHISVDSADRIYVPINVIADRPKTAPDVSFARFRFDGALIDTVGFAGKLIARWEFHWTRGGRSGQTAGVVPFAAQQFHAPYPTGGFVIGWSGDGRLVRTRSSSDTLWVTDWPAPTRPLPDSLRRSETERFLATVTPLFGAARANSVVSIDDVPTVAPVFSAITVDPLGYIWIQGHLLPGDTTTVFDTFDPDGIWLGVITLPVAMADWAQAHISEDAIYAIVEDEDGQPAVLRYRITR